MVGTSELKAAQDPTRYDTGWFPDAAESATALTRLVALAEVVRANPKKVRERLSECRAGVRAASAELKESGRSRYVPLLAELERTLDASVAPPGTNACAAIAAATHLMATALKTSVPPPRVREMVAIAELRGVRGAPAPWRSPIVDCSFAAPQEAADSDEARTESSPEYLPRALSAYRQSLLRFLKTDSSDEVKRLSELSSRVAKACGDAIERRRWRAASALFACVSESGETARPLVKRLAVKLEQALRSFTEDVAVNEQSRRALVLDLEVLTTLLRQNSLDNGAGEDPGLPLKADPKALEAVLEQLATTSEARHELLAQLADAFLVAGKYDHWLEACELAERLESTEALRAAVSRWKTLKPQCDERPPESSVSTHFVQAQAALSRIEGALKPVAGPGDGEARVSGIPVDEALLENLNLMAREIRGARSRAEANLGSLRGGLMDMERTIRTLRSQLESLEVESHAHYSEPAGSVAEVGAQSTFGALSRGIEELAGLKNALEALTEETEYALAAQAGEDAQLEQGLLKTRMTPVGAQFEALCHCVAEAASGLGLSATLSTRGAEVALERSQVDALFRALDPLLHACVAEGLSASALPAPADHDQGQLELEVSQPRFDVRVEISYRGAPLSRTTLTALTPALDALGAVLSSGVDGDGRARMRISIPGPPLPMDLLLVEVGGSRFALPLRDISGVSQSPEANAAPESDGRHMKVDEKSYRLTSLAQVIDIKAEPVHVNGSACVLVERPESCLACRVDSIVGRERMLVRSPGPLLSSNPWVLGVVVDALAAPTLVLDLSALETRQAASHAV